MPERICCDLNVQFCVILPDSPWRTHISQAILKLQEEGKLRELKDRWWIENNGGELTCNDEEGGGDTPELGMDNVGGVFIVVGIGLFIAFIIGIIDFLWNIRQIAIDEKVKFGIHFIQSLQKYRLLCF